MGQFIVKALPKDTHSLDSIQQYEQLCQRAMEQICDPAKISQTKFDLDLTQARNNRDFFDGKYFLINNDVQQDFFCHASIDTFNRGMDLRVGRLSQQQDPQGGPVYQAGMVNMKDQCRLISAIAPEELGGRECHDGATDPLVFQASKNPQLTSLKIFSAQCEESWERHLLKNFGTTAGQPFGMDRVGVDRENILPGTYRLYFENEATDFSCQAEYDLSEGLMMFSAPGKQQAYETLDSCQQAEALQIPWAESCNERTPVDLKLQNLKSGGMGDLLAALGIYTLYRSAKMGAAKFLFPLAQRLGWSGGIARFSQWRLPLFHSFRAGLNQSVWRFVNAEGKQASFLARLFGKKGSVTLQEQPYLSRIDRLNQAAKTPGAPWHRGAGWLRSFGLAAGPANLLGLMYDGVAAMFVDRHHQARQVGTTAVTLGSLSALTVAEHRLLKKQIAKNLAPKSLMALADGRAIPIMEAGLVRVLSPKLAAGLSTKLAPSRLANRLLWVGVMDLGMRYMAVGSNYDAWVNERVTEEIYKQDKVYDYIPSWEEFNFWDDVAFGLTKPIRGGARWLAPSAMEWAISIDNSEIESRIRREDIEDSLAIKMGMKEMLLTLALRSPDTSETEEETLKPSFDFSIFTHEPPTPNIREGFLAGMVEQMGFEKTQSSLEISEAEIEAALLKTWRHNFQSQAAFLVAVDGAQNDWAREIFTQEGLLKPGNEKALVNSLFGSPEHWGLYAAEMQRSLTK